MSSAAAGEDVRAASVFVGQTLTTDTPSDSDHNTILFTFYTAGGPIRLLNWNILCQYGYNQRWGFPYDGYNRRSEANSDYMSRLARTAAQVAQHVEAYRPQAVLLQEGPEPNKLGHGVVARQLMNDLSPWGYTVLHAGEFVTAVQGACDEIRLPRLRRQNGKVHAVFCSDLNMITVNVHLKYDTIYSWEEHFTRQDLETILFHTQAYFPSARVYVVGDLGRRNRLAEGVGGSPKA